MSGRSTLPPIDGLGVARDGELPVRGSSGPARELGTDVSHEHVASIHETREEQFATAMSFLRRGLERGERCLYVAADNAVDEVLDAMCAFDIDVDAALESGALTVTTAREAYLRNGTFDPDEAVAFLAEALENDRDEREDLRVTSEMGWILEEGLATGTVATYESRVNRLLADEGCSVLCQYDRERFSPAIIRDVIRTHPRIAYRDKVCRNVYYAPPEELLGPEEPGREVDRMLGTLLERTETERAVERDRRRRSLEGTERRYRALVENFPNGAVGLFDGDLRYTAAGGELLDELGVSSDDVVGDGVLNCWPDGLADDVERHFRAALAGEIRDFEMELRDRHLFAQTLPIKADDEVSAGMLVVQDVTDTKARRKLEESNRRLEQFTYAASHDLKEPLRMVSSYLQLIEKRYGDDLDDEGLEFLEFAVDGAQRMREMIDGLRSYSRIDARGRDFEPVDCERVFEEAMADLQVAIAESDADITVGSMPRIRGDADQLRLLFENLLTNAIKYTADGSPRVDIAAERSGNEWVVSVADDGIGIDLDAAGDIFEMFNRGHAKETYDGTGIGLALCKRIVECHDGSIRVESEPGEGSTFYIALPAAGSDE